MSAVQRRAGRGSATPRCNRTIEMSPPSWKARTKPLMAQAAAEAC